MATIEDFKSIKDDFLKVASLAKLGLGETDICVQFIPANDHKPPSRFPTDSLAVYVFMYGDRCLKVGKAGPKSAARFCSQHYGINAPSTLAKSLIKNKGKRDLPVVSEQNVKAWICENTSRINFLIKHRPDRIFALSLLETFVQCRLNPIFEGFRNQRD